MGLFQSAVWRGRVRREAREGGRGGGGDGDDGGQVIMNENVCGYEITVGEEEEEPRMNLACSGHTRTTDRQTQCRS